MYLKPATVRTIRFSHRWDMSLVCGVSLSECPPGLRKLIKELLETGTMRSVRALHIVPTDLAASLVEFENYHEAVYIYFDHLDRRLDGTSASALFNKIVLLLEWCIHPWTEMVPGRPAPGRPMGVCTLCGTRPTQAAEQDACGKPRYHCGNQQCLAHGVWVEEEAPLRRALRV